MLWIELVSIPLVLLYLNRFNNVVTILLGRKMQTQDIFVSPYFNMQGIDNFYKWINFLYLVQVVIAMHRVGSAGNTSNSTRPRKEKRLTYVLNDADNTKVNLHKVDFMYIIFLVANLLRSFHQSMWLSRHGRVCLSAFLSCILFPTKMGICIVLLCYRYCSLCSSYMTDFIMSLLPRLIVST